MDRLTEADITVLETIYKDPNKVEVLKVVNKRTKEILCMKKLYVDNFQDATSIQNECLTMAIFKHPHILSLRASALEGQNQVITHIVIFMEYFEEGDLESLISTRIKQNFQWSEEELLDYLSQLVSAYEYLQQNSTAHRDIKPQNIFVKGKNLIVGDLGSLIKIDSNEKRTLAGTPLYLSPILRETYASYLNEMSVDHNVYKSDVYSLGLTFLYMASLREIYDLTNLNDLQSKIDKRISALPNKYKNLKNVLKMMLKVNESERLDFKNLKKYLNRLTNTQIDETNYDKNFLEILKFDTNCSICLQNCDESDLFVLTSGLICKNCYFEATNTFDPKTK